MERRIFGYFIALILLFIFAAAVSAQTTSFVYQGKLTDNGGPANGNYDFAIRLYDAQSGGSEVGATQIINLVTVTNGIFAVNLDFGAFPFDGAARYLEIAVRHSGTNDYFLLNPRQPVTSTPYALKSLKSDAATTAVTANNSLNLGGIAAAQYVITSDARMSDDRNPLPNSPNYVQNTLNQQANTNFNIAGEGRANFFNAATNYRIGGSRVFHLTGTDNTFVGFESGNSMTNGSTNAFFGAASGKFTTTGFNNAFFGAYAGRANATGTNNSFFGANAGISNTGGFNSFFGSAAGFNNLNGTGNSFFGVSSGLNNSSGQNNSFFGRLAGSEITTGSNNTFIGALSGVLNTNGAGSNNVAIGYNNKFGAGVSNSIAIGTDLSVTDSNKVLIGSNTSEVILNKITANSLNSGFLYTDNGVINGGSVNVSDVTAGVGTITGLTVTSLTVNSNVHVTGEVYSNDIQVKVLASSSSNQLCYSDTQIQGTVFHVLSHCSSSRRYKNDIEDYGGGLSVLKRLRPVTFRWKTNNQEDIGFIAEEVNEVEPLFNSFNEKGEVEGVKYGQITTVLVNSVKEQQTAIETLTTENQTLREQLKQQQSQLDALKAIVCRQNPDAAGCREKPAETNKIEQTEAKKQ
ncbi:MAG: tail fiber domain-containing protein [Acidobacteria bacterium]|nr:tail fiber domain-containing protein [Acidobacteriota bacterium]